MKYLQILLSRMPRTPIYSDRFIPTRATSSRLEGYSLLDRARAAEDTPGASERDEASGAYTQMLRAELLGLPSQLTTPDRHGSSNGFTSPSSRWLQNLMCAATQRTAGLDML